MKNISFFELFGDHLGFVNLISAVKLKFLLGSLT